MFNVALRGAILPLELIKEGNQMARKDGRAKQVLIKRFRPAGFVIIWFVCHHNILELNISACIAILVAAGK